MPPMLSPRSRMLLSIDTRTGTEYGVVRTFGAAKFQFTTLGTSRNPAVQNTSILNAGTGLGAVANNAQLLDTPGGGYVAVTDLFVQFAGFTFGKSASAYANPWQGNPGGNLSSFLLGSGRRLLGWIGLLMLAAALAWGVFDWLHWAG